MVSGALSLDVRLANLHQQPLQFNKYEPIAIIEGFKACAASFPENFCGVEYSIAIPSCSVLIVHSSCTAFQGHTTRCSGYSAF